MPNSAIVAQFFSSLMRVYRTFPPRSPNTAKPRRVGPVLLANSAASEDLDLQVFDNNRRCIFRL
jgi:hypothetical protein